MKAIKIDTLKKEVYEVEFSYTHQKLYDLIGCDCFCQVGGRMQNGDMLLVDDEGLYKKDKGAFKIGQYPNALSGNGLIIGTDPAGETISSQSDVNFIRETVRFVGADDLPVPGFEIHEIKDIADFKKHFRS